jgi:dTDP-glucose 4,6-dehydratase
MRILVTGGAGFIGSHFARRLAARGDEVVVLDKLTYSGNPANLEGADVDFRHGDIADPTAVADAATGCEAIVNFAAETHVDRSILGAAEFIDTDVMGTYVLLDWAREHGTRFVQVSTDEVYGDVAPGVSSREDDPLRPSSPYSASKAGGDLQVLAAVRTYGVDGSITRGSNTYGPNQYPEKIVPLFITNALDGEPLPLYGDGRQTRDWLHVEDHCSAVDLVLREGRRLQRRRERGGRESQPDAADPRTHRRRRVAHPPGRGPTGPRSALLARHDEAARAGLGTRARARRRTACHSRLVPRQPRLVGADQVRRVPRVLPPAVRGATQLVGLAAAPVALALPVTLRLPAGRTAVRCAADRLVHLGAPRL